MATLEEAIRIATAAHAGQVDKAGAPYILHPLRVMLRVSTPEQRIVAVLHDTLEDTAVTADALRAAGFGAAVLDALDRLTRRAGEPYDAFIERVAQSPLARAVKLADIEDNMDVRRLGELGEREIERLARYLRAWRRLQQPG